MTEGSSALQQGKIRVAAYCRVSTNEEDQLLSFENQVTYYTSYINDNPKYEMSGIYADEGISGTSTKKREQFKKMIQDCEDGKIDLVITKSISRFARNTQDCLEYSRRLKDLGIGIYFEKENINTLEATGELLFTILSSLAQDESRSISENSKWGIRNKFKRGILHLNTNRFMGYDKDDKGNLIINKKQAEVVIRIFDEYLNGRNPEIIARNLNAEGIEGCMGEPKWQVSTIMGMLQNEKYKGEALLQKTFTADYLTKKMVKNEGQIEQIRVKESHPPIIDSEAWEAVQLEIKRRKEYMNRYGLRAMGRYTDEQPFSCKVICGTCGKIYNRRTWTRSNGKHVVWQCLERYKVKGVIGCDNINLHEKDLEEAFIMAWNSIIENKEEFMDKWLKLERDGNELEKLRGRQFKELANKGELLEKIDNVLVSLVLERVVVYDNRVLKICFLDGTEIEVTIDKS